MTELLVRDADIPADVRAAIEDGRKTEAGRRLMELYGLSCDEAAALVDRRVCQPDSLR